MPVAAQWTKLVTTKNKVAGNTPPRIPRPTQVPTGRMAGEASHQQRYEHRQVDRDLDRPALVGWQGEIGHGQDRDRQQHSRQAAGGSSNPR